MAHHNEEVHLDESYFLGSLSPSSPVHAGGLTEGLGTRLVTKQRSNYYHPAMKDGTLMVIADSTAGWQYLLW